MNADPSVASGLLVGTFLAMTSVVAWTWGHRVYDRALLLEGLETQNAALRREHDQRALVAAKDERTRIAREMHDVVAHSLAVIVVQSDGAAYAARHSSAWHSEQAVTALETVAATARQALGETRALVGVLRDPGATVGPGEHPAYAPTAGIGEVVGVTDGVGTDGAADMGCFSSGQPDPLHTRAWTWLRAGARTGRVRMSRTETWGAHGAPGGTGALVPA